MRMKNIWFELVVFILVFVSACTETAQRPIEPRQPAIIKQAQNTNDSQEPAKAETETYNPQINPVEFTSDIDNKYFTLVPGKKMIYEAETEDGTERIEVYVMDETKTVMGVETRVVWDRVWLNDELIEDTKDWYAQDKDGNVWYFGEESKEIIDNKIISYEGSWEAGVNGAKPGIIMKANPKVNEFYRQEYYKGFAEDKAEIISLNEKITTPIGTFDNCLQTKDWNPLEPGGDEEYKYYCPKIAGVASEVGIESGEQVKLIELRKNTFPSPVDDIKESDSNEAATITEEDAKRIALERVPGEVTDVAIEAKFGKKTYVVEIVD